MGDTVIRVERVGKRYVLGQPGAHADGLRHAVHAWATAPIHWMRGSSTRPAAAPRAPFWALREVSFDVLRGEVLGIVGRNGAGKSTLLKILSRITPPTEGRIGLRGRVASLLEVGTGFHPELSGRENIFLNGAILGMTRSDIRRRFDAIVAFAGVEPFLDTPVKRYSTGMYVRLAFAIAAHVDADVLIVDEVLAVGDAEFQRICLGRIRTAALNEGRTVLFVSHNLAAVRGICSRAVLLHQGRLVADGAPAEIISMYLSRTTADDAIVSWAPQAGDFSFVRGWIEDECHRATAILPAGAPFMLCVEYALTQAIPGLRIGVRVENDEGVVLFGATDVEWQTSISRSPGRYRTRCRVPGALLNTGRYVVLFGADSGGLTSFAAESPSWLHVSVETAHGEQARPGCLRPALHWDLDEVTGRA